MAAATTIARIERLTWILLYAGLLCLVLGVAVRDANAGTGASLMVVGALGAVAGVVLIFVRARMHQDKS